MLLSVDTTTLSDTSQQVIQAFPEDWQPLLATLSAIALSLLSIGALLWPIISKWSSNRQVAAIKDNALSPEEIANIMDEKLTTALDTKEKARLVSEISNWKYKLIYSNDETRPMIEGEIARLENELSQYV